jgi:hypothetical protein
MRIRLGELRTLIREELGDELPLEQVKAEWPEAYAAWEEVVASYEYEMPPVIFTVDAQTGRLVAEPTSSGFSAHSWNGTAWNETYAANLRRYNGKVNEAWESDGWPKLSTIDVRSYIFDYLNDYYKEHELTPTAAEILDWLADRCNDDHVTYDPAVAEKIAREEGRAKGTAVDLSLIHI